jgi:membrane protein implicated in regulation of membrane protease activity
MYIAFAVVGCGYVLVAGFLGHLGTEGGTDSSGGHDHAHSSGESYGLGDQSGHGTATAGDAAAGFHFPFFSPLALATLIASIGGYGLIMLHGFGASEGLSLILALPAALATAYGVTYVGWKLASGSTGSTMLRNERFAGAPAEVTVPIPEGGIGEAVAFLDGHRFASPCRSVDGQAVPRGASVTVVEMRGSTLLVRAASVPGANEIPRSSTT